MEMQNFVSLIGSLVAVFTIPKVIREIRELRSQSHRANYSFVKRFISDAHNRAHPLIIEAGYQALYPRHSLAAPEVIYLLTFARPTKAFQLFRQGQDYLEFMDDVPNVLSSIEFKSRYRRKSCRTFLRCVYFVLYVSLAMAALSPLFLLERLSGNGFPGALAIFLVSLTIFGLPALLTLKKGVAILSAERIIEMQNDHFKQGAHADSSGEDFANRSLARLGKDVTEEIGSPTPQNTPSSHPSSASHPPR